MKRLQLSRGTTGFTNDAGQWVCTGSQMGRRDILPDDPKQPIKLQMERLKWVDGDYDQGGAYWGGGQTAAGNFIFCAWGEDAENQIQVFVRADTREQAKTKVRQLIPGGRFYR